MVIVSILPQPEFGPNDYREDGPHFTINGREILQFMVAFQNGHGKGISALSQRIFVNLCEKMFSISHLEPNILFNRSVIYN